MATLREQTGAFAVRTAQEFNAIRDEMQKLAGSGGGGGGSFSGTADDIPYGGYGFSTVGEALNSMLYVEMKINSFTNNVNTKEMGASVSNVVLNWTTNKVPTKLLLDGEEIDPTLTGKTLTNLNITTNKTWSLVAIDEKGKSAMVATSVTFYNGVYYGVGNVGVSGVNSSFILGLSKPTLTGSHISKFTATPSDGQYIYYAFPSRFKVPTFTVGGFEGGLELLTAVDFTNASGYTESYKVYRSTNAGLGSTTVNVG